MGIFNVFKKNNINFEQEKEKSIEILKNILRALHEKRYSDVINYVDESEIDNLENYLSGPIQETLDINNFNTIDEYGVECNFRPQYEYSQIKIEKYNDNGDFYLEYDLTSNGEKINLVLQLDFKYTKNELKCIFKNIDPQ